jgi:hypothetical protein
MATTVYRVQCKFCPNVHIIDGDSRNELARKLMDHGATDFELVTYYHKMIEFVNTNAYAALVEGN